MKGKKYSTEFKDQVLNDAREIKNIVLVAKKHNIPHSTIHTWLRKNDAKISYKSNEKLINESKDVEVKKLKKIVSDQELKIKILEDLLKKTYQVWKSE